MNLDPCITVETAYFNLPQQLMTCGRLVAEVTRGAGVGATSLIFSDVVVIRQDDGTISNGPGIRPDGTIDPTAFGRYFTGLTCPVNCPAICPPDDDNDDDGDGDDDDGTGDNDDDDGDNDDGNGDDDDGDGDDDGGANTGSVSEYQSGLSSMPASVLPMLVSNEDSINTRNLFNFLVVPAANNDMTGNGVRARFWSFAQNA